MIALKKTSWSFSLFHRHLVILPFRQLKDPSLLKIDKTRIFIAVRRTPGLEYRQVLRRTEQPLVVGIEHAVLQQLTLVIEQAKGEISGICLEPIDNEFGA